MILIIAIVLILGQSAETVGYEVNRNHSIYVPVLFASCEHLESAGCGRMQAAQSSEDCPPFPALDSPDQAKEG